MKLWEKGIQTHEWVEQFTVGNDRILDLKLAEYDIQGSLAHAQMLFEVGIITETAWQDLERGLLELREEIKAGQFQIEAQFEDVHSKIEHELVQRIGEAGKQIHTARSRNDQILVDLHLFTRAELKGVTSLIRTLFETLLRLAETHQAQLLPGYTHTQVAMPSSFGLWFSAFAECLVDDMHLVQAAYEISNQNPLGSAAGYGSSFPINRTRTTELLGFKTLKYNVVAAQMSRGRLEKTVSFALASIASTLGKMASDVCLYMSQNFDFIGFPKELTTGSSIMPHKQNPDVWELIRAKAGKIQNLPNELTLLTHNLTTGYHRDFQLLKESYLWGIEETQNLLAMTDFMLQHIIVKSGMDREERYKYMYSVESLNNLVLQGHSFRDAYQLLGEQILAGDYTPPAHIQHTHEGSIGNLCLAEIRTKMESIIL